MNQPPHVAIDSAVSVVRPQLAITRLIARSGIPERTASIPSEKAYVVSLHLNHANSGEWELWTDDKYTKTGAWPVGGVAMCDLESNSSIRNPGSIDWIHYHVPRATLDSLSDDAGVARAKRLYCVYGTSDPTLYHLTQTILPCLNRPEMFSQLFMDSFTLMICSHLIGRYAQTHEAFPQFKGGLAPWQRRRVVDLFHEHLDGELRLETLADECGISVSHFARSFRRSFGTSAHRYLILKRVEIAKALFLKRITRWWTLPRRLDFPIKPRLPGCLQMWSVRLRQSGGVNTHVAKFLSKYPDPNFLNHTNRSHLQSQRESSLNAISSRI
jgi:AraC-like DNA-binding protein